MPDLWQSVCLFVYIIPHNFLFVKSFYEKFQIIFVFPFYPVPVSRKAERNIHTEMRKFRSFFCSFFVCLLFDSFCFVDFQFKTLRFVTFRCFWSHFHRFNITQCRALNLSAVFTILKIFDNSLAFSSQISIFRVKNS